MRVEMGWLAKRNMRCCYQEKEEWILGRQEQQTSIHYEYFQCSHVLNSWGSLACCVPTRGSSACATARPSYILLQALRVHGPCLLPATAKLKLVTPWAPSEAYQRPAVQGPVTFLSAKVFCPKNFRHHSFLKELDVT